MLGHHTEQFHVRGTEHWMEGESATQVGKGGGFLQAGGSQLSVEGKGRGAGATRCLGGGTWHVNRVWKARPEDVMWAFMAKKEGDSEPMKRTIFSGAQEGPLTGDFLHRAPGLGRLPRERWCLSWGTCTLHGFSAVTNGAHSCLWHCWLP